MKRAGSRAELGRLVQQHLPSALRLAIRLTGNVDHAEDVVQESLLRATRGWRSFRRESSFRTWLYRIVVNVAKDKGAQQAATTNRVPEDLPDQRNASAADLAAAAELGDHVARLVSALPLRQREVVVLSVYEALPAPEIADVLGVSVENVHATLHTARAKLRTALAPLLSQCHE